MPKIDLIHCENANIFEFLVCMTLQDAQLLSYQ